MEIQSGGHHPTLDALFPFVIPRLTFLYIVLDIRVAKAHVATNVRHKAFALRNLACHTFTRLKRED
jgi:hypothetical protein